MGGFISGDFVLKGNSRSAVILDYATFPDGTFQAIKS